MYLQLADGTKTPNILDYMLQVEDQNGNTIWVREDVLDNLTDEELYDIIASQPHLNQMSGIFDGVRNVFANMKERKDARLDAKNAVKYAKADAITSGTYVSPLDKITGTIGGILAPNQQQQPMQTRDFQFPMVTGEVGVNKWYQNPLTLGAITLGALGLMYFATRSRTDKR